jgi:hypothetical protein
MVEKGHKWPNQPAIMWAFTRAESEAITMKSLGQNETTYSDLLFLIANSYMTHYAKVI